jgi:uncharacterized protein (TIGR02246 family)
MEVETKSSVIAKSIAAVNQEFMAAFKSRDVQAIGRFYTQDAELMPPHVDVLKGPDAIKAAFNEFMQSGVQEMRLTTTEVQETGTLAFETGRYNILGASGQSIDTGKYIVIWKQEAGDWRVHRDIWNSSMPAATR